MKKYTSIVGTSVAACLLILFFASYGVHNKWATALVNAWLIIKQTAMGINLRENYYGVTGIEFWYSVRLIIFASLASLLLGFLLALFRARVKRLARTIVEVPFTFLEAVPEPVYVFLLVILFLFLIEHANLHHLPLFPFGEPSWMDTLVPAMVLGLPGAFYLSRVLQMSISDELNAQYVTIAHSKGLTNAQTFYRHVLPNVVPVFTRQVPVVCSMVLSGILFVEYMLGYQGTLFQLVEYGFLGIQRPAGIPLYEPGLIFLVGSFLVGMWSICTLASTVLYDARYPHDVQTTPAPQVTKYKFSWIWTGIALILVVIICSLFPHLVTQNNPNQEYLVNWQTLKSAPFPPSAKFPLGTGFLGQDLLALALRGTADTLVPAVVVTVLTVLLSLGLSSLTTINPNGWLSKVPKLIGSVLSPLPVLVILMTVMHHRNFHSPYQEIVYIVWLVSFESGRGVYSFTQAYEQWYQYGFVEGALSIGRRRMSVLFTHLRSWLLRFTLEFAFLEFSRVLSLMAILAVFQIYAVETYGYPQFYDSYVPTVISAQSTWLSMIGDAVLNGAFMSQEWFLYAPVLCLLLVTVGSNLIARGLRGGVPTVTRGH